MKESFIGWKYEEMFLYCMEFVMEIINVSIFFCVLLGRNLVLIWYERKWVFEGMIDFGFVLCEKWKEVM